MNVVSLAAHRRDAAAERAIDERDLALVAEVERRFAESLARVASAGGVTIDHLHALMCAAWDEPETPDNFSKQKDVTMDVPQSNLYAGGEGDARQTTRAHLEASEVLFRPRYRKLTEGEVDLHDRIKMQAAVLAALFYEVEPIHAGPSKNRERGANVQLAVRNLEDAVYRAVKALTGPTDQEEPAKPAGMVFEKSAFQRTAEVNGASLTADVAAGERKTGITDLPPDQQEQLDTGKPVLPHPDPGSKSLVEDKPDDVVDEANAPGAAAELSLGDAEDADPPLVGSDAFAALVQIGVEQVHLGDLIVAAKEGAGLSAHAWNALPDVERDALIRGLIAVRRGMAASTGVVIAGETFQSSQRPPENDGRGSTGDTATVTPGPTAPGPQA